VAESLSITTMIEPAMPSTSRNAAATASTVAAAVR